MSATWTVRDLRGTRTRVRFVAEFLRSNGGTDTEQFDLAAPPLRPVVTDETGRIQASSGEWMPPVVEIDGEWRSRNEDLDDPWVRSVIDRDLKDLVESACRAHAERLEVADGDRP